MKLIEMLKKPFKLLKSAPEVKLLEHYDISFPPDSLEDLSQLLTKRIEEFDGKFDCFDFEVPNHRLDAFKRIIVARGLEFNDPEDFEYHGMTTIIVGWPGADFEKHEEDR